MLVKSSIVAVAVIAAVMGLSRVDYRDLYNEMYPANGLRRDVLNVCQDFKPTFVRALETDRIGCYDSMPEPVERAIGWVRTTARLAAMRHPSPVEQAEKLLVEATLRGRDELLQPLQFTGYVTGSAAALPCKPTSLALAAEAAPVALARSDEPALAAIGVLPGGNRVERRGANALPILPLSDAPQTTAVGAGVVASGLLDAVAAAGLGDSAPTPAGCRPPA